MPENAKYVGRPTKWGNPFRLTPDGWIQCYSTNRKIFDPWIMWSSTCGFCPTDIVELYEQWILGKLTDSWLPKPPSLKELEGMDLACFCRLDQPCHVDVLLKLINQ